MTAGSPVVDIGLVEEVGDCVSDTGLVLAATGLVDSGLGTEPVGLVVDGGLEPEPAVMDEEDNGLVIEPG